MSNEGRRDWWFAVVLLAVSCATHLAQAQQSPLFAGPPSPGCPAGDSRAEHIDVPAAEPLLTRMATTASSVVRVVRRLPPVGPEPLPAETPLPPPPSPDPLLWWEAEVAGPLRAGSAQVPVNVPTLMQLAAQHSERVQAASLTPWIRATEITQADAAFDPSFYTDTRFDDTSDPVGNTLTTGGPPRFNEHEWALETGVRQQLLSGATASLSQELGHLNSNSLFLVPDNQGSARFLLGVTQPLLKGRGVEYNTSLIVTARFETAQAEAEYVQILQDHLEDVAEGYWSLYVERATLLQRRRHLERAEAIAADLEERRSLDSLESQVIRARAAVATRRSELALAEANIRNGESRLRSLLNAPGISDQASAELVPVQPPPLEEIAVSLPDELERAVRCRPEVHAVTSQASAATVRTRTAENELLPTLDFVVESYVAGLHGRSDVGEAWDAQYSEGAPSYGVGLRFETPLGNRAAEARLRQRQYELSRLQHTLQQTLATIQCEVEIAARNLEATHQTMLGRHEALEAVVEEVLCLNDRWKRLSGDPDVGQLQLDDLLNAQVRLLEEEQALVRAQAAYGMAIIALQRATGTLVSTRPICPLGRQPTAAR